MSQCLEYEDKITGQWAEVPATTPTVYGVVLQGRSDWQAEWLSDGYPHSFNHMNLRGLYSRSRNRSRVRRSHTADRFDGENRGRKTSRRSAGISPSIPRICRGVRRVDRSSFTTLIILIALQFGKFLLEFSFDAR